MIGRSLIFTRNQHPLLDLPIRAFEGCAAGHVGCRIGDAVIDSAFRDGGVRQHDYTAWAADRFIVREVPVEFALERETAADDWLREQIGKPYDWTAIVGFLAWRDWSEPDAWYCSELAAGWCAAGGWTFAGRRSRWGVRPMLEAAHARHEARRRL